MKHVGEALVAAMEMAKAGVVRSSTTWAMLKRLRRKEDVASTSRFQSAAGNARARSVR